MAAKNNCIKRDVCIFAKESFCKSNSECGHYIMEKGFTSTNTGSPKLPDDIKEKFRRWCYEQTSFPREFVQIVNDNFWDLL